MEALYKAWVGAQEGGRRAVEKPLCLAAVGGAAVAQLAYEHLRPESFPAVADWLITGLLMALFLTFVLRLLAPSVPFVRALAHFAAAQAVSTALLTVVFLVFRAGFLSLLAPMVPAAVSAQAAFMALGRAKERRLEALTLGALYAVTSFAFSYFLRLLPGGANALPATSFFAFMGLYAAAAPAALERP